MARERAFPWGDAAVAAALLIGGLLYLNRAVDYGLGLASQPGSGYFPALLGGLLALLSLGVLVRTLLAARVPGSAGRWPVRPMLCILGATAAFGGLLGGVSVLGFEGAGLVPASAVSVFIAGLASRALPLKHNLLLAGFLSVAAWLVFVEGLGLIIPVGPWSY